MSQLKHQVVILSTKKANSTIIEFEGKLGYSLNKEYNPIHKELSRFELYILSDEEIKEGDWFYKSKRDYGNQTSPSDKLEGIYKCTSATDDTVSSYNGAFFNESDCQKIVASTDKSLTEGVRWDKPWPLPNLSEGFINKFIKMHNLGKPITNIMVEYDEIKGYYITDLDETSQLNLDIHWLSQDKFTHNNTKEITTIRLKVRPDNTIITHPIEVKIYTHNQLRELMADFVYEIAQYQSAGYYGNHGYTSCLLKEIDEFLTNK